MHHLNAALRAHALYKRDVEYIVRQGEVIIVDEFTRAHDAGAALVGRPASGRSRRRRGEGPRGKPDASASITFQNYFRLLFEALGA